MTADMSGRLLHPWDITAVAALAGNAPDLDCDAPKV